MKNASAIKIGLVTLTLIVSSTVLGKTPTLQKKMKKQPQYINMTQAEYALYEQKKKARADEKRRKMLLDQTEESEAQEYDEVAATLNPPPPTPSMRLGTRAEPDTDSDKFILSVEPGWLALYGFGAKAEYAITKRITIGISGVYIQEHEYEYSSDEDAPPYNWQYQEYNIGTNIMLTGEVNTNGFYVNPAIGYTRAEITDFGDWYWSGEMESPQFRATVGYQVVYSDFRLGVGVGGRIFDNAEISIEDDRGREVYSEESSRWGALAFDLHIGYIF